MKLFEVFLAPGASKDGLISSDVLADTGAQVFTEAEAAFVGFEGLPADDSGDARVFIACRPSDAGFIQTRLEASASVARFRAHDVG